MTASPSRDDASTDTPPAGSAGDARKGRARSRVGGVLLKRLLLVPVIMLGVAFVVFVAIDLSPNDPALVRMGLESTAEDRAAFREAHGLNDPLPVRYVRFVGDLAHLDLGPSVQRPETVNTLIGHAFPVTIELTMFAVFLAVVISLVLGTVGAYFDGRPVDKVLGVVTAVGQSAPPFWVGVLFIFFFAVRLDVLPPGGYSPLSSGFTFWFSSMIGPAVVLSLPMAAGLTRVVKASMADVLAKDYVRTAHGAGISSVRILFRNVLRNALVTPVTLLGVYLGALLSGAILVEQIFNLPGLGTLLITGVRTGDLAIVRGVALVAAAAFVITNLLVDLAYFALSPRTEEARDL